MREREGKALKEEKKKKKFVSVVLSLSLFFFFLLSFSLSLSFFLSKKMRRRDFLVFLPPLLEEGKSRPGAIEG